MMSFEAIKAEVVGSDVRVNNAIQLYSATMNTRISISDGKVNILKGIYINPSSQGKIMN